jgi:hypothetical protein
VLTKCNIKILTPTTKIGIACIKYIIAFTLLIFFSKNSLAQKVNVALPAKNANPKEFVISYAITVNGAKKKALQQTYNGGLKTVFVKNNLVRIRLVSLMRMQSLYFNNEKWVKTNKANLVQESGKQKSILSLDKKQWLQFNSKNDSVRCDIYVDDTVTILNKLCNKAILTFKDSTNLTLYYLPGAKSNTLAAAEPVFATVPGLVLKYIYEVKNKSVTYTAVDLKFEKISNTVFLTPKKGFKKVKYNPSGLAAEVTEDEDDSIEETGDEDDDTPPATTPIKTTEPAPPKGGGGL